MAIVKPFRGLRPKPEFCKEIASPPYDVLNTEEARSIVKQNPKSFLRINKAELEFSDDMNPVVSLSLIVTIARQYIKKEKLIYSSLLIMV